MIGWKKTLAALLALLLVLPMVPAAAAPELQGCWQGLYGDGTLTLVLGNGAYASAYAEDGDIDQQTGTFLLDETTLTLSQNDGVSADFTYTYTDEKLTITQLGASDAIILERSTSAIPEGLLGSWQGSDETDSYLITFSEDGSFSMQEQPGAAETGVFLAVDPSLTFVFADGRPLSSSYVLEGDTLRIKETEDGEYTLILTRAADETSSKTAQPGTTAKGTVSPEASGLAGSWEGKDATGDMLLTLTQDGRLTIAYPGGEKPEATGAYTADDSTIGVLYDDGTQGIFRYMLMGDTMLLSDEALQYPVTLTRKGNSESETPSSSEALIGTWGGISNDVYGEITMTQDGKSSVMVPSDESNTAQGTYTVSGSNISFTWGERTLDSAFAFDGDTLILSQGGEGWNFTRKPGPLQRVEPSEEEASSAVDSAMLGTWGGMEYGVYAEWTFLGGGKFKRFVPEDETLSYEGTFMSGNGLLAALTTEATLQGSYMMGDGTLAITFTGAEPAEYTRKSGPLNRIVYEGQ